jgi:hypothetical protein
LRAVTAAGAGAAVLLFIASFVVVSTWKDSRRKARSSRVERVSWEVDIFSFVEDYNSDQTQTGGGISM